MRGMTRTRFWEELADPVPDRLAVQERLVLLAHNHFSIVGLHKGDLFSGSRKGKDDLLDRSNIAIAVEASRHIPGGGHALERLDQGLSHVALDARIGHAQREGNVATELAFIPKEVRVAGEELPDDLGVGLLAFGVPHLLVAAQGEHTDGLIHLALTLHDPRIVGKGCRRGIVGVLGAHHLWH